MMNSMTNVSANGVANYTLDNLGPELEIIQYECEVATKEFFLTLFRDQRVMLDADQFDEFCDHIAHNMCMYYINSHMTEHESALSIQYKIKEVAKNINPDNLRSYYCEFFMSSILYNKKAFAIVSQMAAESMGH